MVARERAAFRMLHRRQTAVRRRRFHAWARVSRDAATGRLAFNTALRRSVSRWLGDHMRSLLRAWWALGRESSRATEQSADQQHVSAVVEWSASRLASKMKILKSSDALRRWAALTRTAKTGRKAGGLLRSALDRR